MKNESGSRRVGVMKFRLPFRQEKAEEPQPRTYVLSPRINNILIQLRVQAEKLKRTYQRLLARDRELFEACVGAEQELDRDRATIYANEIAQLRKMSRTILKSQISLEKVILRLETIKDFGDVMNVLGPATKIVKQIQSELTGIVPEVAHNLGVIDEMLESVIVEAGSFTGATTTVMVADSEARRILEEAAEIAAQRMSKQFPELPERVDVGSRENSRTPTSDIP
ncbi:MAG: Snf7 family protein [Thaumarchaeota archaeon]|nr:Snf7 family protein [Nitrososphaerota archaeon]